MAENIPMQDEALIREQVVTQLGFLKDAAEVIGGEGATVEEAFAEPIVEGNIARDNAPEPDWTDTQEAKVREIGRKFGYGAEEDVYSPFKGGVRILEGGKAWKIIAETETLDSELNEHHTEIFCGSPYRFLEPHEVSFLQDKRGMKVPSVLTEYDFVLMLARHRVAEGKRSTKSEPVVMEEFGYEKTEGNIASELVTGQLLRIGHTASAGLVQVLRVEGELFAVDSKIKERNRPNNTRLITLIGERMTAEGNTTDPIVQITSNTYASRVPGAVLGGLQMDQQRPVGVDMYGRSTIRSIDAPVPKEAPRRHIPGDFRLMNSNLIKLGEAVGLEFK
jgi:hypothetical protein